MNPHQAPMHPPGIYNNQPQQHPNNVIPSNYQQMAYQYPQQYLPPNPPVVGYNPIYQNPQANPQSNMRSVPQRDFLPGNQHNQMMHQQHVPPMRNQQMDVLSNVEDHFRPNPVQWPSAPRPFQNDQQFYQYPSNQQHMYMPRPIAPTPTQPPPPPPQQPNYPQMRPPYYTSYPQHISPHSSSNLRYQSIKIAKKSNAHQIPKNQNKSNNPNQNHNQAHAVSQQKPKQNKSSKKQKKHNGHESKKQSGRDMSSIDRIPTSTIIDKQIQKWGWTLPPLPQRSLSGIQNNSSSNSTVSGTTNSNTSENQPSAGFTFSLKSIMTQEEEEEEINNENNDDEIIYNNDSEDDGNNNNSDDSDNNAIYNDEENDNENDNESISNSENDSEEFEDNDSEQEGSNDDQSIDLDNKYRGTPVKRALFLWDQLFNP